ncbi:hypothetical protein H2198_007167 [Neophaeococcomyces mojaviensis]|uniref:Uncharacterized protein n=1 Tax=Neophaeococcomyces mojaviensis TaxID=3383035 RepID=A0ACC3A166_9EURO|nr:hypothetical protein H2198_007167 [Knufia sp. JES_112]
MRLLTYDRDGELRITRDLVDNIPSYAILSHTWGADEEEVAYHEVLHPSSKKKTGYAKIHFCGQQAARDGYQHFWVDTCCINKDSHVELSEAITSMYRWYQQAQICYVYLADVSTCLEVDGFCGRSWERAFRESRWFTRGWTLQELLAPKEVVFFSREGERLGSKTSLEELLSDITGIPLTALRGQSLSQFSVAERMRWTQGRRTKRKEDQAYCLLGIFNVFMYLNYGEGDNAFVRLTEETNKVPKANFTLRIAEGATFDAHGQIHQPCHPATRLDLLQSVRDWTQCVDGKNIFWLNGVAGTGKSTISWTIAKWLSDLGSGGPVALGASFFFKRGEGDRASATLLFPTIANQLAIYISHFDVFLAQAIKAHPQICSKSLGEQFNKLICEPLRQLPTGMGQSTFVLVVDALDECDNEDDIRTVLQLWSRLPRVSGVRLRLFLTSRPELVIRLGFRKMSIEIHQDVVLHDVPQPIIQHDILAFLTDALADIRKEYNLEPMGDPLADDWPGSELLEKLTSLAIPLFIVAATIVRYVAERRQPRQRLQTLLQSRVRPYTSRLGCIYQPVLQAMTSSTNSEQERAQIHKDFRTVVGAIVLLVEPLSSPALAELLDVPLEMIRFCLWPLHSVLHIPQDHTAVIRPLHLSFSEYLTSQDTLNTPFNVNAPATHGQLWRQCLRLLSGPDGLREDICCLRCPGQLRHEISAGRIAKYLPLAVKYACRYWVYHVQSSTSRVSDGDEVHTFLQEHFLHWLEALSLLDRLADGIELVNILHLQLMVGCRLTSFYETRDSLITL